MDVWQIWQRGCELAVSGGALLLATLTLGRLVDGWRVMRAAHQAGMPLNWRARSTAPGQIWVCLASLTLCLGTLVAFVPAVVVSLPSWAMPHWLAGFQLSGWFLSLQVLIRAHVALALVAFFLYMIAESPRWKVTWLACWYAFSMGVAFLQ